MAKTIFREGQAIEPGQAAPQHRFVTLDALRGIAALAIAHRHTYFFFGEWLANSGYLAVDLFFGLSGFVLSYTYEKQLQGGMGVRAFMRLRLVRLYPLYFIALVFGILLVVVDNHFKSLSISPLSMGIAAILGFLFIPVPYALHPEHFTIYPFNHASWTLIFELFANMVHAFLARWLTTPVLILIIAINWVGLVVAIMWYGNAGDIGWLANTFVAGIPRVLFSYTLGILLFRIWKARLGFSRYAGPIAIALLLAVLCVPAPGGTRAYFDILAITVFLPVILLFGAAAVPDRFTKQILFPLGTASYALYVIHAPLAEFVAHVYRLISHQPLQSARPWGGIAFILTLLIVATLLAKFYDPLARRILARVLIRKAPA